MELETSFGRWLRHRRRALDLTQDDLARRVGCASITIQKLEADERRPSRQLAERLADRLQVAADERAALLALARGEPSHDPAPTAAPAQQLRAPQSPPSKLPAPLTRLIGRKPDVAAVRTALLRGEVRLLTLLGPPGIGKTRLSIAVAHDVQAAFNAGASFVALAPLADPALVITTIAQMLGIKERADQPLRETLTAALQAQRRLLVLDNFEHLLDAAPGVVELLEACPGLKALVTSRAALHVRGERLYAVPSLLLPDLAQLPVTGALARTPAVALFVERAQAVLPDFRLTAQNAAAVAAICVRLDGLPLAIELAAARITLLPPDVVLARLAQRLDILTNAPRDLPPRHQTLRAAIDWSYELLDAAEQTLFRRLGVFVGGWTLEAARAVCATADDREIDVLEGMTALLDKSLLQREEGTDEWSRFTLLETIREYALERLVANGEEAAVRQRHAWYYSTLAERAEPLLHGAEQLVWLDRLEADYENLRAVLAWSQVAVDGAAVGLRIVATLWPFWQLGGYLSEGREQLTRMLAHPEAAAPTVARARALFTAGFLIGAQGDFALARARHTESHTLSCTIGYREGVAYARFGLGQVAWLQGEHTTARALHAESLARFRELGERWPIALTLRALGADELYLDACDRAVPLLEESLQLFRALGDQIWYGHALLDLGYAARLQGDDARAAACYAKSLALFRDLRHVWGIAAAQLALGWVAQAQGDAPRAAASFAESLVRYRELGHREGISLCLAGAAEAAGSLGQPVRAAQLFGAAEGLRAGIGIVVSGLPLERATYEESVARVRAQLDSATFAAAWAMGRAMTLDHAIADALEGSDADSVSAIGTAATSL